MECVYERVIDGKKKYAEFTGLSSETKPTENLVTGSLFHEVDTASVYAYNATAGEWVGQIELGGVS